MVELALMHDQVRSAEAAGIRAATLTSADDNREETIARFIGGDLDLLYVAPERASTDGFRRMVDRVTLSLDLSGASLHRRGWRQAQGAAPLKENLACAVLLRGLSTTRRG